MKLWLAGSFEPLPTVTFSAFAFNSEGRTFKGDPWRS